jgi:hypothetical protein
LSSSGKVRVASDPAKAAVTRAAEARFKAYDRALQKDRVSRGSPRFAPLLAASTETVSWVGAEATSSAFVPCTGITSTIAVVDAHTTLPQDSSVYAAWNALPEFANSVWAQTGYFVGDTSVNGFFQIWDLATNSVETTGIWDLAGGANHVFTIQFSSGTTWDFTMDGVLQGSYDLGESSTSGVNTSEPFEALVEKQVYSGDAAWAVPTIEFSVAFQSLVGGAWTTITPASAYADGSYGVEGQEQDSSLVANQIIVGSAVSSVPTGTLLWSGSAPPQPTPTTLTLVVQQTG